MSDTIPTGYKMTEVGIIPDDWETPKIEEVCILINGRGFKPHEWDKEGLPIVRIQNLNGSEEFNYYSGQFDPKILINTEQLLFAWSGSRGTSFGPHVWTGGQALLNYHTWKIVVDDSKIDWVYFFHALRHLTKFIESNAHGASALVHTQKGEMEKFQIPIPPTLTEQRAIADALSDVDAQITALDDAIAKKRDLKQGAMQRLLTGEERLPGFSGAWEVKQLGEIAEIDPENLGSNTSPDYRFTYISLEDVDYGVLRSHSEQIFHAAPSRARRIVRQNDILLSTVRPNLKSHLLIRETVTDTICSTGFSVVRCYPNEAQADYVFFHLFADIINQQIETLLIGSNYPAINSKDVRNLEIPVPPPQEQIAIATILSDMDEEISALEAQREKTVALKTGMMQELLTGKTRLI